MCIAHHNPDSSIRRTLRRRTLAVAAALLATSASFAGDGIKLINAASAQAGGITPGDGPGYPVTITQPGSYRLAGNLIVSDPYTSAIEITADNVTLDLAGFVIQGPVLSYGYGNNMSFQPADARGAGVSVSNFRRFALRNGMIVGFGLGVAAANEHGSGSAGIVEDIHVNRIVLDGIRVGRSSRVLRNTVVRVGGVGIVGAGRIAENVVAEVRGGIKAGYYDTTIFSNTIGSYVLYGIDAAIWHGVGIGHNVLTAVGVPAIRGGFELAPNACNGEVCQ
jgi:hypothetical protein